MKHRMNALLASLAGSTLMAYGQGVNTATLTDQAAAFFDDKGIREIRIYFEDSNWYNTLLRSHQSDPLDPYFPCRFKSGDVEIRQIGCRFKGNSSAQRNGIKKPFKLDFNEYDDNATFMGLKKLNLNNFDLQPDFLREKLLLDLEGKHVGGMRGVYTRLYVNDNFYGLYLAVEQPDKTMMQSRFGSSEDGNLYEAEESMGGGARATNLSWLGADPVLYQSVYLLKTNESANDFTRLIQFLDILNNASTEEFPAKIDTVADVEWWMTSMAINNLVVNLDSYLGAGAEYYIYDRQSDGKFVHFQWDHNESFGITGDGTPRLANPFITDVYWLPTATTGGPGGGGNNAARNARPMLTRMWAVDEYKRLYLRAMAKVLRESFNPELLGQRVTELASLIRPHVLEDPNKAYTSTQFETNLNSTISGIPGINEFVRQRYAYLRPFLDGQASAVDVRINELAVHNAGEITDEAGDADPWVEIHNMGPGPMALNGFYLTDDPANPTKWALPSKTLKDGEHLIVWLDGETGEGDTHASFTVPAEGGKLYLFASSISSSEPVDTMTVAALEAGQSQIRLNLYGRIWENSAKPSPAADNVRSPIAGPETPISEGTGQLLINEFMADNKTAYADPDEAGAFEDWIEIYNPGSEPVDMSGMYVTDSLDNPTKWKIGDGVVIPAGGFLIIMADNDTGQGPTHAAFALSLSGESISIYAQDGKTLIDRIVFGAQREDISYGRSPDGSAKWTFLAKPTPGAANSGPVE